MAPPDDYKPVIEFKHRKNAHEYSFLPLMQFNDVFIVSAIMKGLISHVIWVVPSWSELSKHTALYKSYVGLTKMEKTNELKVCDCQLEARRKTDLQCLYTNHLNMIGKRQRNSHS